MENIPHIIEVSLFLLIVFVLGCIIGWLLHKAFFRSPTAASSSSAPLADKSAPTPKAEPAGAKTVPADSSHGSTQTEADKARPPGLKAPRGGVKDDLKKIKGVGPKLESVLNELGIYHFDQIAAWDRATIDWVDNYLSFKGRIDRDGWVEQARGLSGP